MEGWLFRAVGVGMWDAGRLKFSGSTAPAVLGEACAARYAATPLRRSRLRATSSVIRVFNFPVLCYIKKLFRIIHVH